MTRAILFAVALAVIVATLILRWDVRRWEADDTDDTDYNLFDPYLASMAMRP
jgi:hypothetical protein